MGRGIFLVFFFFCDPRRFCCCPPLLSLGFTRDNKKNQNKKETCTRKNKHLFACGPRLWFVMLDGSAAGHREELCVGLERRYFRKSLKIGHILS